MKALQIAEMDKFFDTMRKHCLKRNLLPIFLVTKEGGGGPGEMILLHENPGLDDPVILHQVLTELTDSIKP